MKNNFKMSLPLKLIIGVIVGIILGMVANEAVMNVVVTVKYILGQFINFCVPLIIIGFIAPSITKLGSNASKMLGIALLIAYISSICAAFISAAAGAGRESVRRPSGPDSSAGSGRNYHCPALERRCGKAVAFSQRGQPPYPFYRSSAGKSQTAAYVLHAVAQAFGVSAVDPD